MTDFSICGDPSRRHDFLLLFEVTDGNPNGDPDAGNMPRVDPETMQGLVTDVCIKRKVRNFVTMTKDNASPFSIYVNDQGIALNTLHEKAYQDANLESAGKKPSRENMLTARGKMCERYFDVRMFGAVMTTGVNAGQVRGPIQITFARSISAVVPMDVAITRVAITKPEDAKVIEASEGQDAKGGKTTEIGRKAMIPYGLYLARGFFTAPFAAQTGVTGDDLKLFWTALMNMWDLDHSAARGLMTCRGLYVFTHENALGNVPAHTLFSRLEVRERDGLEAPRRFDDYIVTLNRNMPTGVTLTPLVEG
jgi:CRISPR-associated protein Csd2